MDFWAHQESAKRNTTRLVALYAFMVIALALLAALIIDLIFSGAGSASSDYGYGGAGANGPFAFLPSFLSPVFAFSFLVIVGVVGCTSLFAALSMPRQGRGVAEAMDGVLVTPQTTDSGERRLLNVVEEMALAGGVPVPPVYILKNEPGINAFAAGGSINDAVIGVTQGAVELLDRSELQAVIAHEFSHIINGDMRINMRFAQLLFGFMALAQLGRLIFWGLGRGSAGRGRNSKGQIPVVLIALVCFLLGLLTAFLGRIIQAGVNRQREFLADASAVQFTRSPALAAALKKIGGLSQGSRLTATAAADNYNHFFFSSASWGLFSTHPPLEARILRIDPQWDGKYPAIEAPASEPVAEGFAVLRGAPDAAAEAAQPKFESTAARRGVLGAALSWEAVASMPGAAVGAAQTTAPEAVLGLKPDTAAEALQKLRAAGREPLDACALIFALLLDRDPAVQARQFASGGGASSQAAILEYKRCFDLAPLTEYVPLIELAIPALKNLSDRQYAAFQAALLAFIQADDEFSFREWILYQLIVSQVGAQYAAVERHSATPVQSEVTAATESLLAALAWLELDPVKAGGAYAAGLRAMGLPAAHTPTRPAMEALTESMQTLQRSPEAVRDDFLHGALAVVAHDKKLGRSEAMFLRTASLCLARPAPKAADDELVAGSDPVN